MVRTLLRVVWEDDYCRKPSYRYNADDDDVGSDIGEDNDKALKSIMSTLMMMSMTVKTSMIVKKVSAIGSSSGQGRCEGRFFYRLP